MTETAPSRSFFERPLWLLTLSSFKEFYREPIALFWVYGFPLVLCLILGYAIRNKPVGKIPVIVVENSATTPLVDTLKRDTRLEVTTATEDDARSKLRIAKAELAILPSEKAPGYLFLFDETRPESVLAKSAVEMTLLRRENTATVKVNEVTTKEPGSRYIDFLFLPGMLGANIMGGGLWGVGYGLVDMRVKKLLKRLVATPMRKSDFLWSMVLSRLIYTVLQLIAFLVFAYFVFGITVRGNWLAFLIVVILGTACFAGFGLLVAARTSKLESAQGLMNLVMLPSYIFSGVFSSANFPDWSQPLISILPLTALNDSLRAVMNEGAGLSAILFPSAVMIAWTAVCYFLAVKWFKWI